MTNGNIGQVDVMIEKWSKKIILIHIFNVFQNRLVQQVFDVFVWWLIYSMLGYL